MADISNIKFNNVNIGFVDGGNSGSQYEQQQQNPKKKNTASKLHVDEIVVGIITDRVDTNFAYVKIPTGTFKALVGENLHKGDSLYFKVVQVNPHLVLKVHEVSTGKEGKKTRTEELLRLLDLPSSELDFKILDQLKLSRKTVQRDQLIEICKTFSRYDPEKYQIIGEKRFIDLLNQMQISKLPSSNNLIDKLIYVYLDENSVSQALNMLEKRSRISELASELEVFFIDIKSNSYKKNNLFQVTSEKEASFFQLVRKLASNEKDKILRENSILLRDFIASVSLWNVISLTGKLPFHYIIPYYFEEFYFVIRVIKGNFNTNTEDQISFAFSVPTENLGKVDSKIRAFQQQLSVYLKAENNKIVQTLDEHKIELQKSLERSSFKLQSLNIGFEDLDEELEQISNTKVGDHFTVVI